MNRSQLITQASKKLGSPVQGHQAAYAIKSGIVKPAKKLPNGRNDYGAGSVKALVQFMKNRSYTYQAAQNARG